MTSINHRHCREGKKKKKRSQRDTGGSHGKRNKRKKMRIVLDGWIDILQVWGRGCEMKI